MLLKEKCIYRVAVNIKELMETSVIIVYTIYQKHYNIPIYYLRYHYYHIHHIPTIIIVLYNIYNA